MIVKADALEWLRSLPDGYADLCVTDPPYASLEKYRAVGTTTRLKKAWFPVVDNEYLLWSMVELYRVAKLNSHCYVFCDQQTAFWLVPRLLGGRELGEPSKSSWTVWKALIWEKLGKRGMGYHYRAQHEMILFLEKGRLALNHANICDVLPEYRVTGKSCSGGKPYPTEKPVELLRVLIEQSSEKGDLVIDPFAGSGSTGVAALSLRRRFEGCDIVTGEG